MGFTPLTPEQMAIFKGQQIENQNKQLVSGPNHEQLAQLATKDPAGWQAYLNETDPFAKAAKLRDMAKQASLDQLTALNNKTLGDAAAKSLAPDMADQLNKAADRETIFGNLARRSRATSFLTGPSQSGVTYGAPRKTLLGQ